MLSAKKTWAEQTKTAAAIRPTRVPFTFNIQLTTLSNRAEK
jgi:hypothetical protein